MTYDECRARYPEFIFESTDIQETETSLNITYHFRITGLADFHPHWSIPKSSRFPSRAADNETVRRLVFCLGMVELISYWKITCSPRVRVLAGCLDDDSIAFSKKQYFHGLGEFFYVNSISADPSSFMQMVSEGETGSGWQPGKLATEGMSGSHRRGEGFCRNARAAAGEKGRKRLLYYQSTRGYSGNSRRGGVSGRIGMEAIPFARSGHAGA